MKKMSTQHNFKASIRQSMLAVLAVSLVLLCGAGARAQSPVKSRIDARKDEAEKEKTPIPSLTQQALEAAADHFMQRFYEKLDIEEVLKEYSVSNETLRKIDIQIITGRLPFAPQAKISDEAKANAYMAQMNWWMLLSAATFTSTDSLSPLEANGDFRARYEAITRLKPLVSSDDLDERFTEVMKSLNDTLRLQVNTNAYNSDEYRKRASRFKEDAPSEARLLKETFAPGLSEDAKIYAVRREATYLYFVEEQGSFKFLTISSRRIN